MLKTIRSPQNAVRADENVQVVVGVDGGGDGALGGIHIRDVAGNGHGLAARRGDLVHHRLHLGGIHPRAALNVEPGVADDDFRPLLRKGLADLRAHPPSPAGDESHLAQKMLRHLKPPSPLRTRAGPRLGAR